MTHRIISIRLLFVFLSLNILVEAQNISSIKIEGAENFSQSNYLKWINIPPNSKLSDSIKDTINYRIKNGLKGSGYYNADIGSINISQIDSSKSEITVSVIEDTPTFINKINFNCPVDSIYLSGIFNDLQNEIFSKEILERSFGDILNHLENSGFPFAQIKIQSVYFFDNSDKKHLADIYLNILPKEKSTIEKIEISGNDKTKDYVITRSMGINEGDLYNQNQIDDIPDRLNRLRFFEPVGEPQYFFNSKNQGVLKITVKEKQTNNFDGVFGYVPAANDNEKGYFTGYVNISLRNLFGTGRAAAFRWLQENRNSQELELRYLEPWILDYPFNIEGSLYQRKQDSTYVQRTVEGQLEFVATQDISASAIISSQSTIPTERKNKVFTVFNSTALTTGINFKIDTRDDIYSPKEGILLLNTYKYTSKSIDGPEQYITADTKTNTTFQRLELDFGIYKELFNDQVAALGIHARELRGSDIEISDLYFLGGTNSLRGYREKQFQGNRIFWSNLEYRYLLTRRTFVFAFFDTGYFLRNADISQNIPEISEFKYGYGFGLNIETSLGVLGVSFALGKGDSFGDGKIHFGIINEF